MQRVILEEMPQVTDDVRMLQCLENLGRGGGGGEE